MAREFLIERTLQIKVHFCFDKKVEVQWGETSATYTFWGKIQGHGSELKQAGVYCSHGQSDHAWYFMEEVNSEEPGTSWSCSSDSQTILNLCNASDSTES